jgi:hypothetical protein
MVPPTPDASSDAAWDATPPALPDAPCAIGTMPVLGKSTCVPVGVTSCASGFATGSTGWGCEAVLPSEECPLGAQRASLGKTTCQFVSECNAPFPPSGAFATVTDATSLATALASVPSGGTIALDSGTYGALTLTQDVNLVGRCATLVNLTGSGERGVLVEGSVHVALTSITISGFQGGLVAAGGPTVDLEGVVFSQNASGIVSSQSTVNLDNSIIEDPLASSAGSLAVFSWQSSNVTVTNTEIRDHVAALRAVDGGKLTVRQSVVTFLGSDDSEVELVGAYSDGKIFAEESIFDLEPASNPVAIIGRTLPMVTQEKNPGPGQIFFSKSEITQLWAIDPSWLIGTHEGGSVELDGVTLEHRADTAFDVRDPGSTCTITGSTILAPTEPQVNHTAVSVVSTASADLDNVAIVGPAQNALFVGDSGSHVTFTNSLVTGLRTEPSIGASVLQSDRNALMTVTGSAVTDSEGFALQATGGSRAEMQDFVIDSQYGMTDTIAGSGILVEGSAAFSLSGAVVRKTLVAFTLAGVGGSIERTFVYNNQIAFQLDGSSLVDSSSSVITPTGTQVVLFEDSFTNNVAYSVDLPPGSHDM